MRPIRIRGAAVWLALSLSACAVQADDAPGTDAGVEEAAEEVVAEAPTTELTCSADHEQSAPAQLPPKAAAVEVVTAEVDPDQLAALPVVATAPPANVVPPEVRQRQQAYLDAVADREAGWSHLRAADREAAQAELKAEMLGGDL